MTEGNDLVPPRHGGDLNYATARYGTPDGGWLDLSTGVNPHPYPVAAADPGELTRLPSPDGLRRLMAAARAAYGAPSGASIVAVPGTEIAIRLLPFAAPAGSVAIVSPTYVSHLEAWRNAGRSVVTANALGAVPAEAEIVVLANPNNPDGRVTSPRVLEEAATRLQRRNGWLVVDEAFGDLAPEASVVAATGALPIVVLRSFGKFFGLPGLRLGFLVGADAITRRLAALLGDWPVSAPAIAVGAVALADGPWQIRTRVELHRAAQRLRDLLAARGLSVLGGTDLFVLVDDSRALSLHRQLAGRGIWTRVFEDRPRWLRLGLPRTDTDFARLEKALSRE